MTGELAEPRGTDERRLAVGASVALGVLAVPALGLSTWVAGWQGTVSALFGLAFVWLLFAGSAALLSWAVARKPTGGVGVLIGGVMVRLPLYGVSLALLGQVAWIHKPSLALTTVAAVAVTLVYEVRLISRSPRLFWVDAAAVRSAATSNATRSEAL